MSPEAPGLIFRVAETREDLEGALRLVYHNYVEQDYCRLNRFQMHFYLYDVLPGTRTLVALDGERVVGTLTLVFDSELGLPSESLYKAELDGLRAAGRRLAEISKLATDRELGRGQIVAVRGLFRLAWLLASPVRGATDFCIMVEPHHEKFYRRAYLFEQLGGERDDPKAGGAPSVLLRLDLETAPGRFRETFGEEAGERNLYWYNCVAPELEEVRAAAAESDARLTELNRRATAARREQSRAPSSQSMRRYVDFRMFALAFNVEKLGEEAQEQRRKGLFDREIEQYDRLLSIMPASYAPERQAEICISMSAAAWHCGLHEKALELCHRARELTLNADVRAESYRHACLSLHHLGRNAEAIAEASAGLEVPDASALARAKLLRTRARLYIESSDLERAEQGLVQARKLVADLPDGVKVGRLRAMIQHNLWILERDRGDYVAAARALREGASCLVAMNRLGAFHYYEGLAEVEKAAGRPLEALANLRQAQQLISPQANAFNAAVMSNKRTGCLIALGDLDAALESLDESSALAEQSRHIGVIADTVTSRATLMARQDRVLEAREFLEKWLVERGAELSERPGVQLLEARAYLAIEAGTLDAAVSLHAEIEKRVAPMARFRTEARLTRVLAELQAGRADRARELAGQLVDPADRPGHEVYRACWSLARALLNLLEDGAPGKSAELLKSALDLDRRGEAWGSLAGSAIQVLRAMTALDLKRAAPAVWDLAVAAAREATEKRRLPLRSRLLGEYTATR